MECKQWRAWLNTMAPVPDELHVSGEVLVPNPGTVPFLRERNPPGH